MNNSYFLDNSQLEKWVEAAEGIEQRYGIEKALGYLIGEKFYNLVENLLIARKMVRSIDEKRKKPDYNPIIKSGEGKFRRILNLDEDYEEYQRSIIEAEEILSKFANLIKSSFEPYEIRQYLDSNPRLGAMGHICSEDVHDFLVENGMIEHSIETEVEDALIFGEIMKYF